MIREPEAVQRKTRFLLCRYVLIFLTGLTALSQNAEGSEALIYAAVGAALFSNVYMGTLNAFAFFDARTQAPILVSDTAMISAVLLISGAGQEFFLFFFFALLMAAYIENFTALAAAAVGLALVSLLFGGSGEGWWSPALVRTPFFLATALFYGYVVLPERTGQMQPLHGPRTAPRLSAARAHQLAGRAL